MDEAGEKFMGMIKWLPYNPVLGSRDIPDVGEAKEDMSLEEWRKVIKEHFPELAFAAETCLSVLSLLLINEVRNCFALMLIDAPSSGKTICLNFFTEIEKLTYPSDDFTPASFVTNIAGRSKKQLEKIDLLPKLKGKMLVVREMASMLCENEDRLRERLGKLTRVLDGEGYTNESGVHGQRGYKGDYIFHMLGASTPFQLRVWKVMSGLGHRLFFLNINSPEESDENLMDQLKGQNYKVKEILCREATKTFVQNLWARFPDGVEWDKANDDEKAYEMIVKVSKFLAKFRGEIIVFPEWGEHGRIISHGQLQIEKPKRILNLMYNLTCGHALINGRTYITMEDIDCVVAVVMSTAPEPRPKLLKALIRHNGEMSIHKIMEELKIAKNTAKKEIKKLAVLGICDSELAKEKEEEENDGVTWEAPVGHEKNMVYIKPEFKWMVEGEFLEILDRLGILG